jgi:hypothetical protein
MVHIRRLSWIPRRVGMATPPRTADEVSFEIGASFLPIDGGPPGLDDAQKQVFACLNAWRGDIENAERTFHVSRVAIAGAIAWEMLENVRTRSPRSVGFGKIHLYNYNLRGTVAEQAERRGYLPAKTYDGRKLFLSTPREPSHTLGESWLRLLTSQRVMGSAIYATIQ